MSKLNLMEKYVKKRVCKSVCLLIAVLLVVFGYRFFFSSNGYWQKKILEKDKTEYADKRLLWRKSETMTMQRMLEDMTLLAQGDSVMVCWLTNLSLPVYRDFIHGAAQPKRRTWVEVRYWYVSSISNGREWMRQITNDRKYKSFVFWDTSRYQVQKDSLKDYRKEKIPFMETQYNKVYPKLGKPAGNEFEEWRKENKRILWF